VAQPITGDIGRCDGTFLCVCGARVSIEVDDMFGHPSMIVDDGLSSVPRIGCPACHQVYDFAFTAVPRPMGRPSAAP
jgi:hypothetical protein